MARKLTTAPALHDRLARQSRPERLLAIALYVLFATFYLALSFHPRVVGLMTLGKWGALAGVIPVAVLAAGSLPSRQRLVAPPALLLLLVFALFLSIPYSENASTSAATFVSVMFALLASLLITRTLGTIERLRNFFKIVGNIGYLVILSAAVMWALGLNLGRSTDRFSAWTDNPNSLALLMAPSMVVMMARLFETHRLKRHVNAAFLVVGVFVLVQTGSRASMLWIAMSGVALWAVATGIGISLYLGLGFLLVGFTFENEILGFLLQIVNRGDALSTTDILSGRSEAWPLGIRLFSESPVVGHGIGSSISLIEENYWVFIESQGHHFHNSYLTIAVETGVIGLAAFVFVAGGALLRGIGSAGLLRRLAGPEWPVTALPMVLLVGAFGHAFFETWLLSAGNPNAVLLWACIWLCWARPERADPMPQSLAVRGGVRL